VILQIGIHSLKDRKVVVIVVPERPPHQMFDPLAVNGAKLAVHFADEITVSARREIDPGSQEFRGCVQCKVCGFWYQSDSDNFGLAAGIEKA
jgi:hypothetical protein